MTNNGVEILNVTDIKTSKSTDERTEGSDDKLLEANNNNEEIGEEKEEEPKEEENAVDTYNEDQNGMANKTVENIEINNTSTSIDNASEEHELEKDSEVEKDKENDTIPETDAVVHKIEEVNETNEDTKSIENDKIVEPAIIEEKQSQESKDDEDVHVQGENQSEYSEIDQRSTAEVSDESAMRGNSDISSGNKNIAVEF